MKFRHVLALGVALAFGAPASPHGNNPKSGMWAGVNYGGVDFVIDEDLRLLFELLAPDVLGPASDCAELAITICGEGRVCCLCIVGSNGDESCSFSCQDAEGNCAPCPECNP